MIWSRLVALFDINTGRDYYCVWVNAVHDSYGWPRAGSNMPCIFYWFLAKEMKKQQPAINIDWYLHWSLCRRWVLKKTVSPLFTTDWKMGNLCNRAPTNKVHLSAFCLGLFRSRKVWLGCSAPRCKCAQLHLYILCTDVLISQLSPDKYLKKIQQNWQVCLGRST